MTTLRQSVSRALRLAAFLLCVGLTACGPRAVEPIRVGILHSTTGTMAISERAVIDATTLALEQINANGGLIGRPIEVVVADGHSDPDRFAIEAARLIDEEKVSVIFGCWTSASRKAVVPIVELRRHLLFYPVQYEGIEQSPHVVYTGATPNQQVMPAVSYAMKHFGRRVFLVGSDYIFPRTANAIIRDQVRALGGEIAGEKYLPLGGTNVDAVVQAITAARPDVILNTINGDSNVAFFRALREAGITPDDIPSISFSLGETELRQMDAGKMAGDYAAWSYFQSLDTPENLEFLAAFRARFGADRVVSDPLEAAWFGVHLWAQAVRTAGSADPVDVLKALQGEGMRAPEGLVYIDGPTQHTWKHARIGRIREDGQFDIVWSSDKPVRPIPFPPFRSHEEWERMQHEWFDAWGGQWVNPQPESAP